ncbi:MAG: hypothetical protein IJY98_03380, partial [Bacteroidaceae bacterium]|nr:hypothetical protein [Bacteroidaceae bacterium]
LAAASLSVADRVLRNSLRAAIQDNLYPHYAHTVLAQWPVGNRPFRYDFNGAGSFFENYHCRR